MGAGSTIAADLPVSEAPVAPVPTPNHDWNGLYIGLYGDLGGAENAGWHDFTSSSAANLGATSDIGFGGGGQIGWNFSDGSWLLGVEADIGKVHWDGFAVEAESATSDGDGLEFSTGTLSTVRARIGLVDDDVLVYATGGMAFLQGELYETEADETFDFKTSGGVVGFGMEWAAANNLTIKLEGLYGFFHEEFDLGSFANDDDDSFSVDDFVVARLGLNWSLGAVTSKAPEPTHDWSGLYVGAYAGAGLLTTNGLYDSDDSTSLIDLGALGDSGFLGGGQIGWNFQQGNLVYGAEADIGVAHWSGSAHEADNPNDRINFEADHLSTIRGRLGYADGDLLVYGTAGVAFLHGTLDDDGGGLNRNFDVDSHGTVFGLGMEWAATDRISLKVEGLSVKFDDGIDLSNIAEGDNGDKFDLEDALIFKVGLNYHL